MTNPELLAPAGNYECLEAVFNHGADAAYIGIGTFNLRAYSPNFLIDELPQALKLARKNNKLIYAVLNTMPDDSQLIEIEKLLKELSGQPDLPDAIVVSDPGVIALCKEHLDSMELHLSTQTGTFNMRTMKFWASQGISRVVLPREFNLEQVRALSKAGICETEVFIHGAMCVSISGRCLLGAYLAGRHANQGECPQPCRFRYDIAPRSKEGEPTDEWFPAEEDKEGVYLFNSKDLNTLPILPEIVETGVFSLKIEGRNKSMHYVSSVVKTYRAALDGYLNNPDNYKPEPVWLEELENLDHRPYTTGFYKGEYMMQETSVSKAKSKIRAVGVVKGILEGGVAVVDVKNPFLAGEELNILPVNKKKSRYDIAFAKITDLSGNELERAVTNRIVAVKTDVKLSVGDVIRREKKEF